MESEKRAVRDFHGGVNSEDKGEPSFPLPTDKPTLGLAEIRSSFLELSPEQGIDIPGFKLLKTKDTSPMNKMPWILPLPKSAVSKENPFHKVRPDIHIIPSPPRSLVLDESPPPVVGPNAQELQDIKNMILTFQSDLQEERTKREILEEKMREFERYPTRQSHEMSERK
jgi:hypothetical protein